MANQGNGVTREFDKIRAIEASTLEQALRAAYDQTVQHHGSRIDLYGAVPVDRCRDLGDPFAVEHPPDVLEIEKQEADSKGAGETPGRPLPLTRKQ
jgi:hypothetical protein